MKRSPLSDQFPPPRGCSRLLVRPFRLPRASIPSSWTANTIRNFPTAGVRSSSKRSANRSRWSMPSPSTGRTRAAEERITAGGVTADLLEVLRTAFRDGDKPGVRDRDGRGKREPARCPPDVRPRRRIPRYRHNVPPHARGKVHRVRPHGEHQGTADDLRRGIPRGGRTRDSRDRQGTGRGASRENVRQRPIPRPRVFMYPAGKAKELEWGSFVYPSGTPRGTRW